jgi:hypothetical protein
MWFKIDDKLHDHRKVQILLEREDGLGVPALGMWLLAGSWSGDQMTDGLVPVSVMRRWPCDWKVLAQVLVEVEMWEPEDVAGRAHFRFHDWLDYNDSAEEILSTRAAKNARMALQRDPALIGAIRRRDKDRCRYCGTQVDWRARRGRDSATYDHIKPLIAGGKNTLENVVICCKGCNDRKGKRSLREAGMTLLAPGSLGAPPDDEDAPDGTAGGS